MNVFEKTVYPYSFTYFTMVSPTVYGIMYNTVYKLKTVDNVSTARTLLNK